MKMSLHANDDNGDDNDEAFPPQSPFPPRYAANWQPTYSILQENLIYQVTGRSISTHFFTFTQPQTRVAATPCGTWSLA